MGSFSPIHLVVLAIVAILLLGGGRFSSLMGDVAKGVKNFKKGMAEEDETPAKPSARSRARASTPITTARPAASQAGTKTSRTGASQAGTTTSRTGASSASSTDGGFGEGYAGIHAENHGEVAR